MGRHLALRRARLMQIIEKIMKSIQIAVEQILTFSVPQILEKRVQCVVPFLIRRGRFAFCVPNSIRDLCTLRGHVLE